MLVNYIREDNITRGVPKAQAYNITMYIMSGLLLVGAWCNFRVSAVQPRHYFREPAEPTGGQRPS